MKAISAVCRKEMLDNVRDRRTMFSTILFGPLFAPLLFVVMIHIIVQQAISAAEERVSVAMVGIEQAPNLLEFLAARGIDPDPMHTLTDLEGAAAAVAAGDPPFALVLDEGFADVFGGEDPARVTVVYDRSNQRDDDRVDRLQRALRAYGERIGALRVLARGVSPNVARPIIVDAWDVSTPAGRSVLLLGILTYFLLFATLMGGMYLATDATAGERERKSLEPLLTLPVSRTSLLLGKVAATCVFMLASLALTLIAFAVALRFLPLHEIGMSSGFSAVTAIGAFLVLAPFALLGAFLMTLVASFTRSYKEAQTWLGLLLLVPTLPVAVATVLDVQPTQALMWVPSMSQHLLIMALIKQEAIAPLMALQSIVSTLIYSVLLALVTIRLYKREALLG
jgi:sodium transport system permease protein